MQPSSKNPTKCCVPFQTVKHTVSSGLSRKTTASELEVVRDAECAITAQRRVENDVGAWRHVAIRGLCDRRVQCWRRLQ